MDEPIHGRGAFTNPKNRFETIEIVRDGEIDDDDPSPGTLFLRDTARTILTHNDSPDVGFDWSVNPYRGCEHGCIYCYARPTHEYLGFSAGLDFESRILVKEDAPALLRDALSRPSWRGDLVALSGVTDPYQPVERTLRLTRRCVEVLRDAGNPVVIVTKNGLVSRDRDLLGELAGVGAAAVCISITTLDPALVAILEPRTSRPAVRLDAVEALAKAGIPVGVLVAPVIPAINDHEIPAILRVAKEAGASFASWILVRLPWGVAALFQSWLDNHFPDRKDKVLNRLRNVRNGKLNESAFESRMHGEGAFADEIEALFEMSRRRVGLARGFPELSSASFRRPTAQGRLFD